MLPASAGPRLAVGPNVPLHLVRVHLETILGSRTFATSPRLRSFLRYVVEKTLAGEGHEIKEFVVATEVYGREADYDPQIDSTVRVEASRLRGKLRTYYDAEGQAEAFRIELPKGSYVPVFLESPAVSGLAARHPHTSPETPEPRTARWRIPPHTAGAAMLVLCFAGALLGVRAQPRPAAPSAREADPETMQLYLEANRLLRQPVLEQGWPGALPASVTQSISRFEQVTQRRPSFAPGWVGLGEAQEWAYELDPRHPRERLNAARTALETARRVDSHLPDAHARLASIYFHHDNDLPRAEAAVRQAIALNPRDVRSQVRHADLLRIRGRSPQALAAVQYALTLDPSAGRLWAHQALILLQLERPQEALEAATHAMELSGGNQMNQRSLALWVKGRAYEALGQEARAENEYRRALGLIPDDSWSQPSLGYLLARTGRTEEARVILQDLTRQHRRGKPACYAMALVHAGLQEDQAALEWLEQGAASGDSSMPFVHLEPRFAHLRPQARFSSLQPAI